MNYDTLSLMHFRLNHIVMVVPLFFCSRCVGYPFFIRISGWVYYISRLAFVVKISADDILNFFLISENRLWHFMQSVTFGWNMKAYSLGKKIGNLFTTWPKEKERLSAMWTDVLYFLLLTHVNLHKAFKEMIMQLVLSNTTCTCLQAIVCHSNTS